MPPHLVHVRCRQCFPAFRDTFHVRTWPRLLSGHSPLIRLAKRGSPCTEQLFPNREPVCPKASGRPADPPVRDRIGGHPPVNQSLTSASELFRTTSPGKKNAPERSPFGESMRLAWVSESRGFGVWRIGLPSRAAGLAT
jgi:hypothetical protein